MLKALGELPFMLSETQLEKLNEIVDRLLERAKPSPQQAYGLVPPFDISRPNIHDSKREFLLEKEAVEAIAKHLAGIIDQIFVPSDQENADLDAMVDRLGAAIELGAQQKNSRRKIASPADVSLNNIHLTGFFYGSLRVIIDMRIVYEQRLKELQDQEKQFWNVTNRAPNHYARTIALRLARLYASEKGQRPTFGVSREGNFPSTDFGRALEEVYAVLEIKASFRNAARWAIDQLTEEDLFPRRNALGGLFGYSGHDNGRSVINALSQVYDTK